MKHEITFTTAPLTLRFNKSDAVYRVTLTGDTEKVLYEGPDRKRARRVWAEVHSHYLEREKVEAGA